MAVAGLHNLSSFGPLFFGDSQVSRPSTRASSLLQMWRDLEGDHVVSHSHRSTRQRNSLNSDGSSTSMSDGQRSDNGHNMSENIYENDNQGVTHSEIEHNDNTSIISEQSIELGESERERVRHIFRGWMNSGATNHSSNGFHLNSRSGSQWLGENECERVRIIREWVQMNAQQRTNQEGGELGSQIEQVPDGLVITHTEIGACRPFRRICGRQTLLDLLVRAQCERKKELQGLLEQRPVSGFAHNNRIQALLRGRFLRNERSIPDKRPSSVAATELGLLRQRHTVSGLREGFLFKLKKSASASVKSAESDSLSSYENNGELEYTDRERQITEIQTTSDSESAADENSSRQEFVLQVTEIELPVFDNKTNVQEVSLDTDRSQQEVSHDGSVHNAEEPVLDSETTEQEINLTFTDEMPLKNEDINNGGPLEVSNEQHESSPDHTTNLEGNNNENFYWRDEIFRSWQEGPADNQWFQNTLDNDEVVGQDQVQESHEEDDLQAAIDSWLDTPTGEVGASVGRVRTFYFPDDDNAQSMEIRELFSRRHVSSLLQSDFRESLDQVLQSHVESQANASGDWELDDAPFSPGLVEQETGQQNDERALSSLSEAADGNIFAPTYTLVNESQPLWDFEFQSADMLHNGSNQQLGTEWEVVNELRIDLARLQQRLNNMQSVLEQCMDMQVELQRSVRQEVSAALNRSFLIRDDVSKGNMLDDESKWDYVRRGICCVCGDSKIDSLLYRCGHMCTCSKCAERLVQGPGKCPMCHAPVVESVRAYFIQ